VTQRRDDRIRARMEEKETAELLQIWEANDRSDYREDAFGVTGEISC
jgi:hypothetical protein